MNNLEARRKEVWKQLQVAHKLPAADREALQAEYKQLLENTARGAK